MFRWDIKISTLQNLTGIKGLSEAKVDKICEAAEKIVVSNINPWFSYLFIVAPASTLSLILFYFLNQNFGYITGSDALLKVSSGSVCSIA